MSDPEPNPSLDEYLKVVTADSAQAEGFLFQTHSSLDKLLITISAGAIGLTVTLFKDRAHTTFVPWLNWGWIALVGSLVLSLFAALASSVSQRAACEYLKTLRNSLCLKADLKTTKEETAPMNRKSERWGAVTFWLSAGSILLTLIGIVLVLVFTTKVMLT